MSFCNAFGRPCVGSEAAIDFMRCTSVSRPLRRSTTADGVRLPTRRSLQTQQETIVRPSQNTGKVRAERSANRGTRTSGMQNRTIGNDGQAEQAQPIDDNLTETTRRKRGQLLQHKATIASARFVKICIYMTYRARKVESVSKPSQMIDLK